MHGPDYGPVHAQTKHEYFNSDDLRFNGSGRWARGIEAEVATEGDGGDGGDAEYCGDGGGDGDELDDETYAAADAAPGERA